MKTNEWWNAMVIVSDMHGSSQNKRHMGHVFILPIIRHDCLRYSTHFVDSIELFIMKICDMTWFFFKQKKHKILPLQRCRLVHSNACIFFKLCLKSDFTWHKHDKYSQLGQCENSLAFLIFVKVKKKVDIWYKIKQAK